MNYIDRVAQLIGEQIPDDAMPGNPKVLLRLYAVLLLAKGEGITPADVHNAWSAWMAEQDPVHPSLVPFDDLPRHVAQDDEPFVRAIISAYQILRVGDGVQH